MFLSLVELPVIASIGISLYPTGGDDVGTLLSRADTARYRVKVSGKGGYLLFSSM